MNTNIDFTPYLRASVGFDRLFTLLQNSSALSRNADKWPPYDIARTGQDSYRILLAVAGFSHDELSVSYEPNLLVVRGNKTEGESVEYLHRGLAAGSFERKFELADYVKVSGASLADGLLTIELNRDLPEAMKPRKIQISSFTQRLEPQLIEEQKRAA